MMLKTPVVHRSSQSLCPLWHKPFLSGNQTVSSSLPPKPDCRRTQKNFRVSYVPGNIKAVTTSATEKSIAVKAVVTAQRSATFLADLIGHTFTLELVSSVVDHKTGLEKPPIKVHVRRASDDVDEVKYETNFSVPGDFGEIGAVFVQNEHSREMYLKNIELTGFLNGPVHITCNSYVQPTSDSSDKRIFFSTKSYLPSQTPDGLKRLREEELENLRGNGQGERESEDRIYDYDVYNDLGDPDSSDDLARPILGGKGHPYPRRCRTGRERCKTDSSFESKGSVYVPRDEAFSAVKSATFSAKTVYSAFHAVVPALETYFVDKELPFAYFTEIDSLYNEGINVPALSKNGILDVIPRIAKFISDSRQSVLRFETPEMIERDKFSWFRDEEFSRQTLAGINPYTIQLVTEWPLKSKLDPNVYGPAESAITKEIVEREIRGFCTIEEAVKNKRLFMLDYHDLLLPYVNKVRELDNMITTLYGSRTLFFLTPDGTLRPLAIELTRPPSDDKPHWRQVFTPDWTATGSWLWRLAKAHVCAHDSGIHQLVSHWLRTHCCVEPYVIATNRQLSAMHPIYRLLHPHFRYTMEINALARNFLINAGGIIETSFSPGKYSMELCSAAYAAQWRFDLQGLPADLINRGLAVEDPSQPHGLKLAIEDYPFANDGLLLWDAIKEWVTEYVNYYYPNASLIESDKELQAWWKEIKTVGHGDIKEGWPELKTPQDLIGILTTMIWVPSGHHAAVNFGQYDYAGYFPNRPTIARKNMPTEEPTEEMWKFFLEKPEVIMLMMFPSQVQASTVLTILDVLSTHSPDEEYLGDEPEAAWAQEPFIKAAFERFNGQLKKLEGIIDSRNIDPNLRNRSGAGVVPYELLKPFSDSGVTGKGVPNSISI
ncbi:linoleate 13S-lipoxygenase 2-1, chloroplastic-like isoform X1 [Cornus florida]|uniref:linoleate 13S-lipoxygenase 2-1, chloroplastic-like isoform X1 n=2 Tax=Cornus florida TaxID=4283 RepID=UPI002899D8D5|nr:linoleate 13S-lipoxygenase 2-1, chloroplastic-like isoform X1 [Cornus florida]